MNSSPVFLIGLKYERQCTEDKLSDLRVRQQDRFRPGSKFVKVVVTLLSWQFFVFVFVSFFGGVYFQLLGARGTFKEKHKNL